MSGNGVVLPAPPTGWRRPAGADFHQETGASSRRFLPRWMCAGLLAFVAGPALAALTINSATLNGGASVTVDPGATINVSINQTNTGGTDWRSTQFTTTPATATHCENHPNYDSNGTYTEYFTVTAPTQAGTYAASFVASSNNGCGGTLSATYTLPGAIIVPFKVVSISRAGFPVTTGSASVSWTVRFNGAATGVDAGDFVLVQAGGATGASITNVSGGGTTWTVTASTGTANAGTVALNLVDNDSIVAGGVPLGGAGAGNGNYSGPAYTLLPPVCDGAADIIFCDDFERSNPGSVGNGWTVTPQSAWNCSGAAGNTGCAGIDADIPPYDDYANPRPNPTRAMFTRWAIVTVDSPTINLAGRPGAELSFWIRRGDDAFSECPEAAGENYLVRYLANDNTWKTLAQYPSSPSSALCDGKIFLPVIELPADALHANFKIRFYQPSGSGKSGSGGAPGVEGYDYWHMDNIIVREKTAPGYVGAFCDNFEGGLGRWSISAEGAPNGATIGDANLGTLTAQSAPNSLDLRWGYVVASTFKTDLSSVSGNITYWVKSGTTADRDPDSGEDLVVEYLTDAGAWSTLATYPGNAGAGSTYTASHAIPADAKHANFRLRFRHLNSSGYDKDYWHVDDVCVGDILPTTDLALTKTGEATLVPGTNTTYTLTVKNNGPGTLSGSMQIVDTLPVGLGYLGHAGTGWTCSANGQIVTCNWSGTLPGGLTAPVLTLTVSVGASVSGLVTNTATLSGTVVDSVTANNTATFSSGSFSPSYVFTNGACVKGIAFGSPGQTCSLVSWTEQMPGLALSGIYVTAVDATGKPMELSTSGASPLKLQFGLSCHNPPSDAGVQANVSGVGALPLCAQNGQIPSTWSGDVNVVFAANSPSVGPFAFSYDDVGKVELYMRNSTATNQIGSSGPFVVKPYGILLNLTCAAPFSPELTGFCPAGETVSGTVTAVRYDALAPNNLGAATPNFGRTSVAQMQTVVGADYLVPALVAPTLADGGTATAYNNLAWVDSDGDGLWENGEGIRLEWPEVGSIRITGTLNYLGAGDLPAAGRAASEAFVGTKRFYPYRMSLADNGSQEGAPLCDLTYTGQPFRLGFKLSALNKAGNAVKNYGLNGYTQRATGAALSVVAENADNGTVLGGNIVNHPAGTPPAFPLNWPDAAGAEAIVTFAAADYAWQRGAPIAPLDALQVGVRFADDSGDAVPLTNGNMNAATAGACANCDALALVATRLRHGVLRLDNAYGSELLPLRVPARVLFCNAAAAGVCGEWRTNTLDTCTAFTTAAATLGNYQGSLAAGNFAIATHWNATQSRTNPIGTGGGVSGGNGVIVLDRPTCAAPPCPVGSVDLTLTVPAWLGGGAGTPWPANPAARLRFGSPKAPYIYLRERY